MILYFMLKTLWRDRSHIICSYYNKIKFVKIKNKMIKISINILKLNKPITLKATKFKWKNSPAKKMIDPDGLKK